MCMMHIECDMCMILLIKGRPLQFNMKAQWSSIDERNCQALDIT